MPKANTDPLYKNRSDNRGAGALPTNGKMNEFNWRPGIGDPTIGGWVTVALYLLAVWSTWQTCDRLDGGGESRTWRAISVMFIALGLNKQLDLQTAFTEIGRMVAVQQGWYGERQIVQVWFIIGVAIVL